MISGGLRVGWSDQYKFKMGTRHAAQNCLGSNSKMIFFKDASKERNQLLFCSEPDFEIYDSRE